MLGGSSTGTLTRGASGKGGTFLVRVPLPSSLGLHRRYGAAGAGDKPRILPVRVDAPRFAITTDSVATGAQVSTKTDVGPRIHRVFC